MEIAHLAIDDVVVITPPRFLDDRGYFSETFNRRVWSDAGISVEFVQDNQSLSLKPATIRGLHFQIPPHAQTKLVRVIRGAVFDVLVDIRTGSPTYGRYVSAVLSADAGNQLLVPEGFAHGFCTLEAETEVLYKVTDYYSPEHDKGLLWNDPELGIDWPVSDTEVHLSERDRCHPPLSELPGYFTYVP